MLKGLDSQRVTIVLSVAGSVLVLGGYLWVTSLAGLTPRESAAWTVVLFALQVFLGVVLGRRISAGEARAQYRPFIGSAIRRTLGLRRGLERVQSGLLDTWERDELLPAEDRGLRGSTWQEQLYAIHGQLTELIVQADSSLDDWRDVGLADDEYQRVINAEAARESKISQLVTRIKDLQQRTRLAPDESAPPEQERILNDLGELSRELEDQLTSVHLRQIGVSPFPKGNSRALLRNGLLQDAIDRYSELISNHPDSHGHYVGRAQAYYQSGDLKAALADLDVARRLAGDSDPSVTEVRIAMLEGRWSPEGDRSTFQPIAIELFTAIESADVARSRELVDELQDAGLENPAYLAIDRTIVSLLANDPATTEVNLREATENSFGEFVKVNVEALRVLVDLQNDRRPNWRPLRDALLRCPGYTYERSPLRFLERGLRRQKSVVPASETVFGALRNAYVDESLIPPRAPRKRRVLVERARDHDPDSPDDLAGLQAHLPEA